MSWYFKITFPVGWNSTTVIKKYTYYQAVSFLLTVECYSKREAEPCENSNGTWVNRTCFNTTYVEQFDEERQACNDTGCFSYVYNSLSEAIKAAEEEQVTSSEEYFKYASVG